MIILGVDTSTEFLAVSLISEKKVFSDYHSIGRLNHGALLSPIIKKALKAAKKRINDIDLLSVGLGPGSFTGLRVGITTMRALSIALNKPIVGVPTLDAIAHNVYEDILFSNKISQNITICPIVDAKKAQVYSCLYGLKNGKIIKKSAYLLKPVQELINKLHGDVFFLGDALPLYKDELQAKKSIKAHFISDKRWFPKGSIIAKLGLSKFIESESDNPNDLLPLYLYKRDCNVKKY